jgi:hypothetical protein
MSMTEELHALGSGRRLGIVQWDRRRDRYSFRYDDAWRGGDGGAFPLVALDAVRGHGAQP